MARREEQRLIIAISAAGLKDDRASAEPVAAAARAGFDGVELLIGVDAACSVELSDERMAELARQARDHDVRISSLNLCLPASGAFDALVSDERALAVAAVRRVLELGAIAESMLVLAPIAGGTLRAGHADTWLHLLDALTELRFEAEDRGVPLALWEPAARLLATPTQAADFVDAVNSPAVGYCMDVEAARARGDLLDWVETLAGRLACVYVAEGGAARGAYGPALVSALRDCRYDGSLTLRGVTSPADAADGWRVLLADEAAERREGR